MKKRCCIVFAFALDLAARSVWAGEHLEYEKLYRLDRKLQKLRVLKGE